MDVLALLFAVALILLITARSGADRLDLEDL
jgi:hypothetical protein